MWTSTESTCCKQEHCELVPSFVTIAPVVSLWTHGPHMFRKYTPEDAHWRRAYGPNLGGFSGGIRGIMYWTGRKQMMIEWHRPDSTDCSFLIWRTRWDSIWITLNPLHIRPPPFCLVSMLSCLHYFQSFSYLQKRITLLCSCGISGVPSLRGVTERRPFSLITWTSIMRGTGDPDNRKFLEFSLLGIRYSTAWRVFSLSLSLFVLLYSNICSFHSGGDPQYRSELGTS